VLIAMGVVVQSEAAKLNGARYVCQLVALTFAKILSLLPRTVKHIPN
jgi:hypothetical protein